MKKAMALIALTILTACDYSARKDLRGERNDRLYREAMDDYRAGRMDAAVAGLEKAVQNDPANASARFQLACLQQDLRKDFLSAYCGYREYLMQHPESDRARLARDRMAICEEAMARKLATKYGLNAAEAAEKRLADARAEVKALKDRVAAAERNLGTSQERVRALSGERDRLLGAIKGFGDDRSDAKDMQAVLAEKERLEKAEETDTGARQTVLAEKRLLEEDEGDETSAGSSLLPVHKPEEPVRRDAVAPAPGKTEDKAPDRPKTYVVQDGDTLFGIAKRFYGSIQPWKMIRDANKALISADNRLRTGDKIVLP